MDNRPNVGFLVHIDMVSAVLGCRPVSGRLISVRLRAAPFNVTIIQVYAPTSEHDDNEADNLELSVTQGNREPYCNAETNERSQTSRILQLLTT